MNTNKDTRPVFHILLDGRDALTAVHGWKNLREYRARQEAKGRVVGYYR